MSDAYANLKETIAHLEFSMKVRSALTSVRLIHESDEETFARVMRLARSGICRDCRGYGSIPVTGRYCGACEGTGERSRGDADDEVRVDTGKRRAR
jgi:RecJ-like exonuclease